MSRTIFCGSRGFPVASAGQLSEQRPHSVQVYPSSSCFHEKSRMDDAPKVSLFSMSSISESAPLGVCLRKNTFGSVVTMWRCFDCGRYAANARTVTTCVHQDQKKTTADDSPGNTELRRIAPAIGGGV